MSVEHATRKIRKTAVPDRAVQGDVQEQTEMLRVGSGQQGGQAGPGTTTQIGKTGGPADQANKTGIPGH